MGSVGGWWKPAGGSVHRMTYKRGRLFVDRPTWSVEWRRERVSFVRERVRGPSRFISDGVRRQALNEKPSGRPREREGPSNEHD